MNFYTREDLVEDIVIELSKINIEEEDLSLITCPLISDLSPFYHYRKGLRGELILDLELINYSPKL